MTDVAENIICNSLHRIENDNRCEIIHAAESGSRAWGFESPDSDYDVRFIYVKPRSEYLRIDSPRDVIELMSDDKMFDYSGWDLKKALNLLKKSNPTLIEWFQSQIKYIEIPLFREHITELLELYYNPKASYYHYVNMARNNKRHHLEKDRVSVKKYLYVLRAILAARWSKETKELVPIQIQTLIDEMAPLQIKARINCLVVIKADESEQETIGADPVLNDFIDLFLLSAYDPSDRWDPRSAESKSVEPANEVFRFWVEKVNNLRSF